MGIFVNLQVTALLRRYNPSKLSNVPNLLKKYKGDYGTLLNKIRARYVKKSEPLTLEIPSPPEAGIGSFEQSPSPLSLDLIEEDTNDDVKQQKIGQESIVGVSVNAESKKNR